MWLCPNVELVLSHSYEELSLSPQVTWLNVALSNVMPLGAVTTR